MSSANLPSGPTLWKIGLDLAIGHNETKPTNCTQNIQSYLQFVGFVLLLVAAFTFDGVHLNVEHVPKADRASRIEGRLISLRTRFIPQQRVKDTSLTISVTQTATMPYITTQTFTMPYIATQTFTMPYIATQTATMPVFFS